MEEKLIEFVDSLNNRLELTFKPKYGPRNCLYVEQGDIDLYCVNTDSYWTRTKVTKEKFTFTPAIGSGNMIEVDIYGLSNDPKINVDIRESVKQLIVVSRL